MAEKRKDRSGRVLRTGESQRHDNTYQYRYKNVRGQWKYIYAPTLKELREKSAVIQKDIQDGIDYCAGEVSVIELAEKYIAQKTGVRYNTKIGYNFVLNLLKKQDFGYRKIKTIKPSDAKQWFIDLYETYSYSTLTTIRGVLRPAFDMAVDDDAIRRNPFSFRVVDVVANDSVKRKALKPEEVAKLLMFMQDDKCRRRHYNEVVILLGTGLRISELYGLTKADVDFQKKRIRVERQLLRTRNCEYFLEEPKTDSGKRYVPMDDMVMKAFREVLDNRKTPKVEWLIDKHTGFVFLDKDDKPKVAGHLEHALKRIVDNYNKSHTDQIIATPHVLRHTFCTDKAHQKIQIKELQYLMGHADAGTTLNIYMHSDYDAAERAFREAVSG